MGHSFSPCPGKGYEDEHDPREQIMTKTVTIPGHREGLPVTLTPELIASLARRIRTGPDAERITTYAPFTGEPITELPQSTAQDVATAFARARHAQRRWAQKPVKERAQVFLRYHDLLLDRQHEVLDLIQAEGGKTRRDAFLEVADVALTSLYYARHAPSLLAPKRREGLIPALTSSFELHHPKGVVGMISPWNYPLNLAAGDTIPALLAGNAVVHKPDSKVALTALWAADLLYQAGLPKGLWQIVLGPSRVIGDPLIEHADYVMFTGSTAAGRKIAQQAGERLIDCSLELGGKNPMIILEDADLARTSEGAVRACFSGAGQVCVAIERVYVHHAVYDAFVTKFLQRIKDMRLGAAYDYSCDMGTLISQEQLENITAHVEDARSKGATVLIGGRARPDIGPFFYEPTVLTDVTAEMDCYTEETFGPVVSLYWFSVEEEAIAAANATPYGLSASVWTRNGGRGRAVGARLRTGSVNVNEAFAPAWAGVDAPMGGMGDSGLGRRHGAAGLLKYTEAQTIAEQHLISIAPVGLLSPLDHERLAQLMTAGLKLQKWIRLR
jgi:succinate-semialdehyde dehydrogenase / glutarate-semialdehyde dehydrogenase